MSKDQEHLEEEIPNVIMDTRHNICYTKARFFGKVRAQFCFSPEISTKSFLFGRRGGRAKGRVCKMVEGSEGFSQGQGLAGIDPTDICMNFINLKRTS
jgi:hypothetical protein